MLSSRRLVAVALVSATLLTTELALTRIFSVTMYYHFAFLAISIALFGLSASGVFAYVASAPLGRHATDALLARQSVVYAVATLVALFCLVRIHVTLTYSPENLAKMLLIYALAALPFFTGGLVLTLAISRYAARITAVYAADLAGAAAGCLALIPLLNRLGAPGVILAAAIGALVAAYLFAPETMRARVGAIGVGLAAAALAGHWSSIVSFDVAYTKGHQSDRVLFSKWNSFSRIGVYDRPHGDWSLSSAYTGPLPDTRYMDIDSAASTPILALAPDLSNVQYLRYELTAFAYQLISKSRIPDPKSPIPTPSAPISNPSDQIPMPFTALVIGPGGGRDLVSAVVFGASHVDAVEINPIIADDVMRGRFREYSGGIYTNPRVRVVVDDGRSFVRRSPDRYDVIQASLVDTWAATAAGAYTLTENTLYTVEAFHDYLDHLTDRGMLTVTRWVFDGVRLVSLAQEVCEARGWSAADRLAIVRHKDVATFLLKKTPFTPDEVRAIRSLAADLRFDVLYAPGPMDAVPDESVLGTSTADYAKLVRAADRHRFYDEYARDVTPTTDDRPFFFLTTKLKDQFDVAFGRSMLFGNGLSALITLLGISCALVALFIVGPLVLALRSQALPRGWLAWLVYFGALGAGFMLIEVSVLQQFVLLLGHPVYSLTVTLFSLLLGTSVGAAWSLRFDDRRLPRSGITASLIVALVGLLLLAVVPSVMSWAILFGRPMRMAVAVGLLVPMGVALGVPMPTGIRALAGQAAELVPWTWGINGAFSVLGATAAIFIAMNWGFRATLVGASATYLVAACAFALSTQHQR